MKRETIRKSEWLSRIIMVMRNFENSVSAMSGIAEAEAGAGLAVGVGAGTASIEKRGAGAQASVRLRLFDQNIPSMGKPECH
jgi:hypothetical protein